MALDCTWKQINFMLDEVKSKVKGEVKSVKLNEYETVFWRY